MFPTDVHTRKIVALMLAAWLTSCSTPNKSVPVSSAPIAAAPAASTATDQKLQIEEVNPSQRTSRTKQTLLELIRKYDLTPFLFTRHIRIESKVVPYSHPVLTLNTFYSRRPNELLSSLLHEELHWFLEPKEREVRDAIEELRKLYPKLPEDTSILAKDERSTYLHLIVCWLELEATSHFLGREVAADILERQDHYEWIYETVLQDQSKLKEIARKFSLIPKSLDLKN